MSNSELSSTVHVSGLSPETTEQGLNQFFSFCGQIKSIERVEKRNATIVFEKESAAKTSLMLDGGTLDNAVIQVSAPTTAASDAVPGTTPPSPPLADHEPLKQEDKPRSAIAAEYLAHGYILGDQAIAKAIALDQKHGISSRFSNYFHKIQERAKKVTPSTTAKENSPVTPITKNLSSLVNWSQQYYEKALNSKHGAKVKEFYTTTSKQALDVHSEARRIAEEKTGHSIFQFPCMMKNSTATDSKQPSPSTHPSTKETESVSQATPTSENEKK